MAEISISVAVDDLVNGLDTKQTVELAEECLRQLGGESQIQAIRSALTTNELRGLYEAIRGEFED